MKLAKAIERKVPMIAHVILRFDIGGLENGLINLINALPSDEYHHTVICLKDSTAFASRLEKSEVQVIELHKKDGKDPACYWRMWRVLRRLAPDIVHTRNANTLEYQLIAALAGVKYRIHGEHGWDLHDLYGTSWKYRTLRRLIQPIVDSFITVSRNLESYLVDFVGIESERVHRIYNGVDTTRFRPNGNFDKRSPTREGACNSHLIIGTVGRLHAVKNQMLLIRAFSRIIESSPDLRETTRLVLVGDGPLAPEIRKHLSRSNVAELVSMPGSTDDVPSVMSMIDIFVLPSLNEGISNTVLEAMASGLPVVATHVGGTPEIVDDGKTGLLVKSEDVDDMANAIRRYIEKPEMRKTHGAAARARIESMFSLAAMVAQYGQSYADLLSRSSGPSQRGV